MTHIASHLSNPYHPYTEEELIEVFDADSEMLAMGVTAGHYNRMPTVLSALLFQVKERLERENKPPKQSKPRPPVKGTDEDDLLIPGPFTTRDKLPSDFKHSATLKNPNPPAKFVDKYGNFVEWQNEYYTFRWNPLPHPKADEMQVERYLNDERIAGNVIPVTEARKLWAELAATGFERSQL